MTNQDEKVILGQHLYYYLKKTFYSTKRGWPKSKKVILVLLTKCKRTFVLKGKKKQKKTQN